MLRQLLRTYQWRKLRLRVWEKRLHRHFQLITQQYNPAIPCTLHVTAAPFYGGSVVLDRQFKRARIYVHIPLDCHLTADERQVLSRYALKTKALPYFILFHECYHLLDALDHHHRHSSDGDSLEVYHSALKEAVQYTTPANYRSLDVEQRADEFAYQLYMRQCTKAG